MQTAIKLKALRSALGEESFLKGDEAIFFCPRPVKHPSKPKLSVNLKTDWFHCWVCEWKGKNLIPILLQGDPKLLKEYRDELGNVSKKQLHGEEKKYDTPILPNEFRPLSVVSRSLFRRSALDYLSRRRLGADDILRWKLGYCETGDYRNRVIIPSYDEHGSLNFFVGRAIYDDPRPYKHGNFDKDIIWNDYMIDWEEPVVVTEGPFDVFRSGENAIALQGSILGDRLLTRLVLSGVDVYFAMDTDAFGKQLRIIEKLLSYGTRCFYVDLGGKKDVGSMEREEFRAARASAVSVRSDLDILRMRVLA